MTKLYSTWKDDILWTKSIKDTKAEEGWTSFVLSMRDSGPVPDLLQFGQFLASSLTFTESLTEIKVFVNDALSLHLQKKLISEPVGLPYTLKSTFGSEMVTETPQQIFTLSTGASSGESSNAGPQIFRSTYEISAHMEGQKAVVQAHFLSAKAATCLPEDMVRQMERVTKKLPPPTVTVNVLQLSLERKLAAASKTGKAARIVRSFVPSQAGSGRIFIGYKTSQTTGFAAHLGAPFFPTVEREAMDLQDPCLRIYNLELLSLCGMVLRLGLEQVMTVIGKKWKDNEPERAKLLVDAKEKLEAKSKSSFVKGVEALFLVNDDERNPTLVSSVDATPLCSEERQAIMLVKSFCPRESTPEQLVGLTVAQAFRDCLARAPPVLTRSGVIPGNQALLPAFGMDKFIQSGVVKNNIYESAREYHDQMVGCRLLCLDDLKSFLESTVLDEDQLVLFLKWWVEFHHVDQSVHSAVASMWFRETIRFSAASEGAPPEHHNLKVYNYYNTLDFDETLPLPPGVLPKDLQSRISLRVLQNDAFKGWWTALTFDEWMTFISRHRCIYAGKDEDADLRLKVLTTLSRHYHSILPNRRHQFGKRCYQHIGDKECIPIEWTDNRMKKVARPSQIFLGSAIVKIKSMHFVSKSLREAGISDPFLEAIGVRSRVTVDLLLQRLEDLKWNENPKALLEYLASIQSTLTHKDIENLSLYRYLPAEGVQSRLFAPKELYLPSPGLRRFSFVKLLQWPAGDDLYDYKKIVSLLRACGMKTCPPVRLLLRFVCNEVSDAEERIQLLSFVCDHLKPHGLGLCYDEYTTCSESKSLEFLPCVSSCPLEDGEPVSCLKSPRSCYTDTGCAVMGFPVLDTGIDGITDMFGTRFQCARVPPVSALVKRLLFLVRKAKRLSVEAAPDTGHEHCDRVKKGFREVFQYLSLRAHELDEATLSTLRMKCIVPCMVDDRDEIEWPSIRQILLPGEAVDPLLKPLFYVVDDDNLFLKALGAKLTPSAHDVLGIVAASPSAALEKIGGEANYRLLLRKISGAVGSHSNVIFGNRPYHLADIPFLLAYTSTADGNDGHEETTFTFAKAEDVYIIDNSSYGSMFQVPRAPFESDLEEMYARLGSKYISEEVGKRFQVESPTAGGVCGSSLRSLIEERRPLLVSPNITSRPIVDGAASVLDSENLTILQAVSITVIYSMSGLSSRVKATKRKETTCCVKKTKGSKYTLYVTENFDWFDVGSAIGELILKRCYVEDAFFIGALLETPLDLLRARGFPVDRMIVQKAAVLKKEDASSSISESLAAAAQSAAATSLGAAQAILRSGVGDEGSSWFSSNPMSLIRSAVEKRSIEAEETDLAAPLLVDDSAVDGEQEKQLPPNDMAHSNVKDDNSNVADRPRKENVTSDENASRNNDAQGTKPAPDDTDSSRFEEVPIEPASVRSAADGDEFPSEEKVAVRPQTEANDDNHSDTVENDSVEQASAFDTLPSWL